MPKPKLHIVKIGGNVINDEEMLIQFLEDFSSLEGLKILIHGGGKKATELATQMGLVTNVIDGRRITDETNLEVVTMVYAGLINKKIVTQLQSQDCNAIGLSGADLNCILAHKRHVKEIDYGFVGDIDMVDSRAIGTLLKNKMTPVFCAITHNKKGQLLNTNADTIASEVAAAMAKNYEVVLTYCFDKKGVLRDINDENSVITTIDTDIYVALKNEKLIANGMLPKLHNCFYALHQGVSKIIIGNSSILKYQNQQCTILTL